MSTNRDFNRTATAWLAEGPSELADRVLDAALDEVHMTHQRRRLPVPWRIPTLNTPLRLAAAIAIIAVLGYAGLSFFSPNGGPGSVPSPTRSPTAPPAPVPTATPDLLDTTTWTTYTSERYGFSIAHPADWIEEPAVHDWTLEVDGIVWMNRGSEVFIRTTAGGIRVSAWSVPVEPGTTVEEWIDAYCPPSTGSCAPVGQAIPVQMDGHDGLLVPFESDTQAFSLIDNRVYGVAVWWAESEPAVMPYGGARKLLEAFLSTMELLPGGPLSPAASPSPS